jgi:RecB family exonuclease
MPESAARFFAAPAGTRVTLLGGAGVTKSEHWRPHSVWDELEFLRDELGRLRAEGVAWRDVAVYVPEDELYKRVTRRKLMEWNVPLHDPRLAGAWKDDAGQLRLRDLLRAVAGGLKLDDVRAWLGPGPGRAELFEAAYKSGVHGGAGQWRKLLAKHDVAELKALVESAALLGRSMTAPEFLRAARDVAALIKEIADASALVEFAEHLCDDRPYLADFRARLPRYLGYFEEYLETSSRAGALRSDGVQFVSHGVWLPTSARHAFWLGANLMRRPRPPRERWDWEAAEVRSLWTRLHSGAGALTFPDRVARDEAIVAHALASHGRAILSSLSYDLSGAPLGELPKRYLVTFGEKAATAAGGHPRVGWLAEREKSGNGAKLLRPDLAAARVGEGSMRVSEFEDYLRCPFLYYSRHVLKLEREDELGLDADARARGTILHKILERFLSEEIAGRPAASIEEARERLGQLVEEIVTPGRVSGMFRHKPLIDRFKLDITAAAGRWAEWELENRKKHPTLKALAVEKSLELEIAPGLKLRGKADRIDSDGKHAVVIDYKSGGAPLIGKELASGVGAQLLAYSRAIQQSEGLEPAAAFYLKLGRKVEGKAGIFLKKHQGALHTTHARNSGLVAGEFDTLFERVSESWRAVAENLKAGDFTPRPARGKKDCDSCDFKGVCGFEPGEVTGE